MIITKMLVIVIMFTIFSQIQTDDIFMKKCYEGSINVGQTIGERLIPFSSKLVAVMSKVYGQKVALVKDVSMNHEASYNIKCHLGRCITKVFSGDTLRTSLTTIKESMETIKMEANCRVIQGYELGLFSNLSNSKYLQDVLNHEFLKSSQSPIYDILDTIMVNLGLTNFEIIILKPFMSLWGLDEAILGLIRAVKVLLNSILGNLEQALVDGLKVDLGLVHCELGGKNRIFNYCKDIDDAIDMLIKTVWELQQPFEDCVHGKYMEISKLDF